MELERKSSIPVLVSILMGLTAFYAGSAWTAPITGTHVTGEDAVNSAGTVTGLNLTLRNATGATPQAADQFLRPFLSSLTDPNDSRRLTLGITNAIENINPPSDRTNVLKLEAAIRPVISTLFATANPPPVADQLEKLISGLAVIRAARGGGEPARQLMEQIVAAARPAPSPSPSPSSSANPNPSSPPRPAASSNPNPSSTPGGQGAGNGATPSPTPSARERALERELQQRALQDAARQAAAEQAAQQAAEQAKKDGGKGGGGGGSGGGSGGGKGGGSGGDGGGDSGSQPKGLEEALKHLNQGKGKEPTLSELRSDLGRDKDQDRGAKGDEKKKEDKFSFGSSKASKDSDFLKPKKELDNKKSDLTSADSGTLDPSQGLGPKPNVKTAILSGPTSIPNSLAGQYGSPSSGTVDASFGGGDSGGGGGSGFGGASVSGGGGPSGPAGGGGTMNFNSVGQAEPYTADAPIKKILQEVQSINASSEGGGDEEGSSSENSDYTSKTAVKRGDGLFANQIVLTSGNPRAKGRGIMAYVGGTRDFCQGPQGKQMALCELRKEKGEVSSR